mgnify:CR=1 FL=1
MRTHAQKFLLRLARGRRHKDSVAGALALASPLEPLSAGGAGAPPTAASAERGGAPAAAAGAHPAAPSGTAAGGQRPPARGSTLTPPLCAASFAAGAPARDAAHSPCAHKLLGPGRPHALGADRGKERIQPHGEDWGAPPFLARQFPAAALGPDAGGARGGREWLQGLPGGALPAARAGREWLQGRAGLGPEFSPPGAGAAFDAGGGGLWGDGVPAGMRWDGADAPIMAPRAGGGGFAGDQAERAAERMALEQREVQQREDERQSLAFLVGRDEREWDDAALRAEGGAPEGWECGWRPAQAQAQRGAFQ